MYADVMQRIVAVPFQIVVADIGRNQNIGTCKYKDIIHVNNFL